MWEVPAVRQGRVGEGVTGTAGWPRCSGLLGSGVKNPQSSRKHRHVAEDDTQGGLKTAMTGVGKGFSPVGKLRTAGLPCGALWSWAY